MDRIEKIIDLLLGATQPRDEYPPGERDRSREKDIAQWKNFREAGLMDEAAFQQIVSFMNSGLDYQRDHPLNEIDDMLDAAMAMVRELDQNDFWTVVALVDLSVRQRLAPYFVRCASRALATRSADLCEAAMLALLLTLHGDGEEKASRDVMVSLAPLHVAAQCTEGGAPTLFERYATLAPTSHVEAVRVFGRRSDVTLKAFGWAMVKGDSMEWVVRDG